MNIYLFEMATEAYKTVNHIPDLKIPKGFVEHLANAVAAEEREACAKLCDEIQNDKERWAEEREMAAELAAAIRARGAEAP